MPADNEPDKTPIIDPKGEARDRLDQNARANTSTATHTAQDDVRENHDKPAPVLPAYPPKQADPDPVNTEASPAGPGKPLDGSPAVNTYTTEADQKAEFAAGEQDWQSRT